MTSVLSPQGLEIGEVDTSSTRDLFCGPDSSQCSCTLTAKANMCFGLETNSAKAEIIMGQVISPNIKLNELY